MQTLTNAPRQLLPATAMQFVSTTLAATHVSAAVAILEMARFAPVGRSTSSVSFLNKKRALQQVFDDCMFEF